MRPLQRHAEAADWAAAGKATGTAARRGPAGAGGAAGEVAGLAAEFDARASELLALLRSGQLLDTRRAPHLRRLLLRLSFGAPATGLDSA